MPVVAQVGSDERVAGGARDAREVVGERVEVDDVAVAQPGTSL
jgi:hypothetical protein